jgi:hypothetical protein
MAKFDATTAKGIAKIMGIDFEEEGYSDDDFLAGMHVELEHGLVNGDTNVSDDDAFITAKIVKAHLNENKLYYDPNVGLEAWEKQLDACKGSTKGKKVYIK